jgi:2-keto-4-pentenoate hydratase/2-oxohepta-3-ene-1,7-dioic acid hydratase in catechol pathway
MKLCTYPDDQLPAPAVVFGDSVYDLRSLGDVLDLGVTLSAASADPLREILESPGDWAQLSTALAGIDPSAHGVSPVGTVSSMNLLPPIIRPDKVICIGLNYRSHAEEAGMELTKVPTFFVKLPNAFRGHGDAVVIPAVSRRIDWEGELAVVIGRQCKSIDAANAFEYVAGYTILNDVTARDYQFKTSQWILGKTFDSFSPMGPVIVSPDEFPDPGNVLLETVVSGTRFQYGSTDDMVFPIPELIEFVSSLMTLEAGDIIATGTPSGIGALQKPPRWLVDSDVVDVSIPGIGTLSNPVTGAPLRDGTASS